MENSNRNDLQNNQQNVPAAEGKGNNHNRRHRSHRGGRHHHGGQKKDVAAQKTQEVATTNQAAEAAPANAQEQKNNNGKNGNHQGNNRNRRNRHGKHHNRGETGASNHQKTLASTTEGDALSLADLRARIVIKAADGSVPAEESHSVPTPILDATGEKADAPITDPASLPTLDELLEPAPEVPTPVADDDDKIAVIGVRFRTSGKMYYFDPVNTKVEKGNFVIVETARGPEYGEICLENSFVSKKDVVLPLRPLIRVATEQDKRHNDENREKEEKAIEICKKKIEQHKLEMKLIDAQYAFDNSKLLFYFSAEGRVDFRDLVKDLASVFHTRIELRQIGIRDEARMLGGLGACGRTLCCSTFLPDFAQVSIKMAKDQNLSLNSSKISGVCGRLMCCLHYEAETYAEEIKKTPSNDTIVKTEDGIGTVISSNPLAGTIRVILKDANDQAPKQYHRDNVTVIGKEKRGSNQKDTNKDA